MVIVSWGRIREIEVVVDTFSVVSVRDIDVVEGWVVSGMTSVAMVDSGIEGVEVVASGWGLFGSFSESNVTTFLVVVGTVAVEVAGKEGMVRTVCIVLGRLLLLIEVDSTGATFSVIVRNEFRNVFLADDDLLCM